jgi:hypothetical protein
MLRKEKEKKEQQAAVHTLTCGAKCALSRCGSCSLSFSQVLFMLAGGVSDVSGVPVLFYLVDVCCMCACARAQPRIIDTCVSKSSLKLFPITMHRVSAAK